MALFDYDRRADPNTGKDRRQKTCTLYDLVMPEIEDALASLHSNAFEFHMRNVGDGLVAEYFDLPVKDLESNEICTIIADCTRYIAVRFKLNPPATVVLSTSDGYIRFRARKNRMDQLRFLYGVTVKDSVDLIPEETNLIIPYSKIEMDYFMDIVRQNKWTDLYQPSQVRICNRKLAAILVPPIDPREAQVLRPMAVLKKKQLTISTGIAVGDTSEKQSAAG